MNIQTITLPKVEITYFFPEALREKASESYPKKVLGFHLEREKLPNQRKYKYYICYDQKYLEGYSTERVPIHKNTYDALILEVQEKWKKHKKVIGKDEKMTSIKSFN